MCGQLNVVLLVAFLGSLFRLFSHAGYQYTVCSVHTCNGIPVLVRFAARWCDIEENRLFATDIPTRSRRADSIARRVLV